MYKTLVKPMITIHGLDETKQHLTGKREKLLRVLDEYMCLKIIKKPIETCKKVNFLTTSPTAELPAGNTEAAGW
jgi:hypothetical protein